MTTCISPTDSATATLDEQKAPLIEIRPQPIVEHGISRNDEYFWLREKQNPDVIALLHQENAFTEKTLENEKKLREELFTELKARISEDDSSFPSKVDHYYYYSRVEKGSQYSLHCRRPASLGEPRWSAFGLSFTGLPDDTRSGILGEEILLDENSLALGKNFFALGVFDVSPDHNWLAFSIDNDGSEKFALQFKDLRSGQNSPEIILNTAHSLEWANDNRTVFYNMLDEHERPDRLFRHVVGSEASTDVLIHKETDPQLFVNCSKTRSRRFIFLNIEGSVTSEIRFIDANQPESKFKLMEPRRRGVLYSATHRGESFYLVTNDIVQNFRLVEAPIQDPQRLNWKELRSGNEQLFIEDVEAFESHLILHEREDGLPHLRVIDFNTGEAQRIAMPEPAYELSGSSNPEFESPKYRFGYTSLVTPTTVYDFNVESKSWTQLKQQRVPSGYDSALYQSERIWATSPDGSKIPISLVYRKTSEALIASSASDASQAIPLNPRPLYLYGYGSYGMSMPASFSTTRLSLLDRGFVFAIAHIRGGSEMGRAWYEDGKFLKKKNTFIDFNACAHYLINAGYTREADIVISGGSAGGMLVGASINLEPTLFRAAVAKVPFVDVLNTMMDASLPLTTLEYEEWGNPADKIYYDYIKSYSPYDNVEPKAYPHLLVTSGLNDPRVTYWEPMKWVAKLRAKKTDQNLLLHHINMLAGHQGASGRYEYLKEIALEYAFILKVFGKT